jgi:hypothetical protein
VGNDVKGEDRNVGEHEIKLSRIAKSGFCRIINSRRATNSRTRDSASNTPYNLTRGKNVCAFSKGKAEKARQSSIFNLDSNT